MSADRERAPEVVDEEGLVDRERKRMILEARREIREWSKELFPQVEYASSNVDEEMALRLWGDRVREYLMTIEPVLVEESLPGSEEVYGEATIGKVRIDPPEKYVEAAGRPEPGEPAPDFEVHGAPRPKTVEITGLVEVIRRETVAAEWDLDVRRPRSVGGRPRETKTVSVEVPLPKHLLRDAVRVADVWLQQADLGVELSAGRKHSNYTD